MIVFSVCICTYNRTDLLSQVLESVVEQTFPAEQYEIIVVDNGSTDDTRTTVEALKEKNPRLRYFYEPQQGLSYARNRAARAARGVYLAYTDDDCRLPANWLSHASQVFDSVNPDIFGGPYYAIYDTPKPVWFKDEYGSFNRGEQARFLGDGEYLSGGNLFIRRELLQQVGGFCTDLGMRGASIAFGEEPEVIQRVRRDFEDKNIYYDPQLTVYHLANPDKWNLIKALKRCFQHGRYQYLALEREDDHLAFRHIAGLLLVPWVLIYEISLGMFFRKRSQYPYYQNYLYERIFYWVRILGKLFERVRCRIMMLFQG